MEEKRVGRMIHLKHNNNNIPGLIPQVRSSTEGRIYVDYTPSSPYLCGVKRFPINTLHMNTLPKRLERKKKNNGNKLAR